jgi:putative ATPase
MEPLASKYRPRTIDDIVGQEHLTGSKGVIRKFIESQNIPSMIFWGPPGTGKTTLAYVISQQLFFDFHKLLAVNSGKSDLRKVLKKAMENRQYNKKTILFLDEIHRWNKAQQDALLPYVEKGIITLIGATTENPSFTINSALLSRTKVFIFKQHTEENIKNFIKKIAEKEFKDIKISEKVLELISQLANGDLRSAMNILEMATTYAYALNSGKDKQEIKLTSKIVEQSTQKSLYHDKRGEEHYNIISAIHKSMRSSNPSAAAYWITRMLEAGDDPLYVARRLLRFSSEDIGNADPQALILANAVFDASHKVGRPECDVFLIQLGIYLAKAPKNNSAYMVEKAAKQDVKEFGNLPVPLHFRNAESDLMKEVGYGDGYEYDHDLKDKKSEQQCMPDKLKDKNYLPDKK